MSLRRKLCIVWALLLPIPFLAAAAFFLGGDLLPVIGLFLMLAAFILFWHWSRCPNCGRRLGRYDWRVCPRCRQKIDFDAKPKSRFHNAKDAG